MSYYIRPRNYIEIQGRLHEDSCKFVLGGDVQNINDLSIENFRTYDLISPDGVWSVKTHMDMEGRLTENAMKAYQADFEYMLGWNRSVDALELDVKALRGRLPDGVAMPKALNDGSLDEAVAYLKNNSNLVIPGDHVEAVRNNLISHAHIYPETYGLSEQAAEEDFQNLAQRVQGSGLNATDTPALVKEKLQQQQLDLQEEIDKSQSAQEDEEEYCHGYGY